VNAVKSLPSAGEQRVGSSPSVIPECTVQVTEVDEVPGE
jgi:hypothetical protein